MLCFGHYSNYTPTIILKVEARCPVHTLELACPEQLVNIKKEALKAYLLSLGSDLFNGQINYYLKIYTYLICP